MRHRSRHLRRIRALGLLAAVPLAGGAAPASGETGAKVTVTVSDIRSTKGTVRACMTSNPERFPKCRGDANSHRRVVPAKGTVTFTFTGVKPGRYAIALLHDENDNGKADRALGMMPKEGFGFSRDARERMGPPSFDDAAIDIGSDPVSQRIRMRYMF